MTGQAHDPLRDEIERLADGIAALRTVYGLIKRGNGMGELGGKKLATDFGSMMADVRKAIDAAKGTVADAVRELKGEITAGAVQSAKAIRAEATAVRAGYAELLGNAGGQDDETETQPLTTADVGKLTTESPKAPGGGLPQVQPFPQTDAKAQGSGT